MPTTTDCILIADDEPSVCSALRLFIKSESWTCVTVNTPAAALAAVKAQDFALVLTDLNFQLDTTSGNEGIQLIQSLRALDNELPIIAMTGWGSIDIAVAAMRHGADDFIEKPWDNTRLASSVRNLLALGKSRRNSSRLAQENALLKSAQARSPQWIAQSPAMQTVMKTVQAVAGSDVNILITGENGTGKTQIAELIHRQSKRASQSFVSINMGAIPETIFESELFGHVKGAFTDARDNRIGRFELADRGTLFLDEIGNIALSQQAKLLHVLENGRYEKLGSSKTQQADVRVISATNADLTQLIQYGQFRKDLLYRLNSVTIELPPLRQRQDDIAPLTAQALQHYTQKYQKNAMTLADDALAALQHYDWPGNIRELSHVIERAVLLSQHNTLHAGDLNLQTSVTPAVTAATEMNLEQVEKELIVNALRQHDGNALAAAKALGLSRSAFYRRLEKFGL